MSPRRARRHTDETPRRGRPGAVPGAPRSGADGGDPATAGPERVESWPDGDWVVRLVPGAGTTKAYRCPGCDQEIVPGTPHLVAWPADGIPTGVGVDERRHWHTACWEYRLRRG